jgi:hypothetical protein
MLARALVEEVEEEHHLVFPLGRFPGFYRREYQQALAVGR